MRCVELSIQEYELLYLLAKRVNPNNNDWCIQLGYPHIECYQCLICDETYNMGDDISLHGKFHIEESNLLAFI
jgi:hypothetical protein